MSKEKRMAGSYEIEQSIYIGEKEVLFGVNKAEEYPFMVCYCSYNNPLSAPWCTEAIGTDDYLEAMQVFTDRVSAYRRVGCEKSAGVAEFSVLCLPQL